MIWFISDTHFFHKNVLGFCNRPFDNVEQMNQAICDNWASVVKRNDIIFHLGDITFGSKTKTIQMLKALPGHKMLIMGNHDSGIDRGEYGFIFKKIRRLYEIKGLLGNDWYHDAHGNEPTNEWDLPIVLCHYPMREWNQSHRGSWQLHGHSHGKLEPNTRRQYDVGVDNNNFYPVSLEQLDGIMRKRGVNKHHE